MKQNFIPNAQELFAALWNPLARILVILLVVSAWCCLCGGYFFSKGRIAAASFTSRWWLWVQRPLPGTQQKGLSGKSVTMSCDLVWPPSHFQPNLPEAFIQQVFLLARPQSRPGQVTEHNPNFLSHRVWTSLASWAWLIAISQTHYNLKVHQTPIILSL